MPEETKLSESNGISTATMLIIGVALLLAIAFGVAYMFIMNPSDGSLAASEAEQKRMEVERINALVPIEMMLNRKSGNFSEAQQARQQIEAAPIKNADEQALAVLNSHKVEFFLTGDINAQLRDIQDLKDIAVDPSVNTWVRVRAINTLQVSYCSSGRDQKIFDELYKPGPLEQFGVPGDPDLSARKVAEWSYSIKPSSFAAIRIARWYGDELFNNKNLSAAQKKEYADIMHEYVEAAAALVPGEAKSDPNWYSTVEYSGYRFWRARVIAQLAYYGMEPYTDQYIEEFESMIQFADAQDNKVTDDTFFARQILAQYAMRVDKNDVVAKKYLDQIAQKLDALENPLTNSYVRYLRNESRRKNNWPWQGLEEIFPVSPAYKAAVDRAIALRAPAQ